MTGETRHLGGPIADGRAALMLMSLGLLFAGVFALALGFGGRFLPHDERFLGMTAEELCSLHGCRIVHFMLHDRIAFGGALVVIGLAYTWLVRFPLRERAAWAWWLLLLSGGVGFASFLAYLEYGYLDVWHGVATLLLIPCYVIGLAQSRRRLTGGIGGLLPPAEPIDWRSARGVGRLCLLASCAGLILAGLTIFTVGATCVFVPQDLTFLGLSVDEMVELNPRLVPVIAHDRAGFGGAVCCGGIALFFCVYCGPASRERWRMLAAAGVIGYGAAIGAHPAAGYLDPIHLAPAVFGAVVYLIGLILTFPHTTPVPPAFSPPVGDRMPRLVDFGSDLERISPLRRVVSLATPFVWCAAYFVFAFLELWPLAVFALVALSFVTYGSVSHDLVHRNLNLPHVVNDALLCVTELLALRSGHAYQAAHLDHHARYPHLDDVEAAAAHRTLFGSIVEGFTLQPRLWVWALRHAPRRRNWIVAEGIICLLFVGASIALVPWTPAPLVYVILMIAGSWIIPLVTSYIPHDPHGDGELFRTRVFRGRVASLIALEHLYHLEHHLYPSVPHQNWPELARRLDPHFERAGVKAIKIWF